MLGYERNEDGSHYIVDDQHCVLKARELISNNDIIVVEIANISDHCGLYAAIDFLEEYYGKKGFHISSTTVSKTPTAMVGMVQIGDPALLLMHAIIQRSG